MTLPIRFTAAAALALAAGCASDGGHAVTPQRPTFSNDTRTTAPGTVEVELGYFQTEGHELRGTTTTSKYGYDETTEIFVSWSPYLEIPSRNVDDGDPGDAVLGVRHRFEEAYELPELAWELGLLIPSNSNETPYSNGEPGILGAGIATGSFEDTTWTGYLQLGVLGDDSATAKLRQAVAAAGSIRYTEDWAGFAEIAKVNQTAGDPDPFFATLGFAWTQAPSRVFDFGIEAPLNSDADWRYFFGLTWNLGRVFGGESPPVFGAPE